MCEELFKENLAVKYSLYRNTLSQKEFVLIQEFYAWLSAQQSVQADGACVHENKEAYEFGYYCKDCGMANPPRR